MSRTAIQNVNTVTYDNAVAERAYDILISEFAGVELDASTLQSIRDRAAREITAQHAANQAAVTMVHQAAQH